MAGLKWSRDEKGSFLVLGIFFVVIFVMIGGLAVDISRYLVIKQKARRVSDGAALAGAEALNQYTDDKPDTSLAFQAVLDYLEDHYGTDYLDLYEKHSPTDVDGIEVREIDDPSSDKSQYRVGVVVYGGYAPYFMPRQFLSENILTFYEVAVAETYYDPRTRVEYKPIDCGLVADGKIELSGNNFNQDVSGDPATICSNGDIDASKSSGGILGDIYTAGNFGPPGGDYGKVNTSEPVRESPEFQYDYPEHSGYDVVINDTNYNNWDVCSSDTTARSLTTKDGDKLDACVSQTGTDTYVFNSPVDLSKSNLSIGDSVGIYSQGSLTFTANTNRVDGGIYSTGDITVEKNDNKFIGNKDKLGGLTLWAAGDLDVHMNTVQIDGLVGADGSFEFTGPPGGGEVSGFKGMMVTNDVFYSADNSQNTRFLYDPSLFDYDALDMKDWEEAVHQEVQEPHYSQVSTNLIY